MFTKSTAFRSLFAALCALLTVFACAIQTKIAKPAGIDLEPVYGLKTISSFLYRLRDIFTVSLNPPPSGVLWLIAFIALYLLYRKTFFIASRPFEKTAAVLSVFFSFCLLLGASYYEFDSWKFVFSNRFQFFCSVFASAGYSILLYACLKHLFNIFDRHKSIDFVSQKERQSVLAKLTSWFFRHPFLAPYLAIGATWGATLCIFLPGSVSWDGFWQLNQFFSVPMPDTGNPVYFEPSNHQPYFATCIIGSLMQIGRSLGSDSLGILFVVVVQSTICLSVYASVIALQIRLLLPRALSLGTTAFFALCPIWASYAQAIEKDTLFAAFFCLFSLALFNILRNRSDPRLIDSRTWLALAFSSVMVCIFRNNGLWAILPTFILLVIALRPLRRKILLSLGSGILLSISLIFVCLPLIGIPKGSSGEALSIPFQQTARYLTEYPNDVTPDQMEKINNVLAGDNLAALYNPELSDPVKGTFKSDATTEDLLAYGTVWLEMLAQHPDSYIQATLNNTFGYLYPSGVFDDHVDTYFFATNASPTINTGYFDTNYCFNSTERIREIVVDASYVLERVPVLGLTVSCAMYVWIFLILLGYAFSRRNALALLLSIPSAITVLICFASPVNGCIRYLLPVMATLPIIAMACLMHKDRRNEEESQENTPPNMQASAQRFVRSIVKTKAIPIENPPGKRTEGNGET